MQVSRGLLRSNCLECSPLCSSNKNPAFKRGEWLIERGVARKLPIPKSTSTAITPGTTSIPPAAAISPTTSITCIGKATSSSTAIRPATSATVAPGGDVHRFMQLGLQQVRPAFSTPCSSNAFFDAVVSFLGGIRTSLRAPTLLHVLRRTRVPRRVVGFMSRRKQLNF